MARGLSRQEAERLIVRGFFQDVLDRIELEPVREALGKRSRPASRSRSGPHAASVVRPEGGDYATRMDEIGLFPLGLVLLPTEQVPLHIFEPRYRELIGRASSRTSRSASSTPTRTASVRSGRWRP